MQAKTCCLCCFLFSCFYFVSWFWIDSRFCAFKIFSLKKKNCLEIVLINSYTILLISSLFSTKSNILFWQSSHDSFSCFSVLSNLRLFRLKGYSKLTNFGLYRFAAPILEFIIILILGKFCYLHVGSLMSFFQTLMLVKNFLNILNNWRFAFL